MSWKEAKKFILKGVRGPWNTVTSIEPMYCKEYVVCVCKFLIHCMYKNKVFLKSKKSQNFASTFSRILVTDAQFSAKCLAEMCLGVT